MAQRLIVLHLSIWIVGLLVCSSAVGVSSSPEFGAPSRQIEYGLDACSQQRWIGALQAFDRALAGKPAPSDAALAWEGKGLVLQLLDDQPGAMEAFSQALQAAQQAQDQPRIRRIEKMALRAIPPDVTQWLREVRDVGHPAVTETAADGESSPSSHSAQQTVTEEDADCGCDDDDQPPASHNRIPTTIIRFVCGMLGILLGGQVFLTWRRRRTGKDPPPAAGMPASAWRGLAALMLCLALAGAGVAGYLTLAHMGVLTLACDDTWFHCDQVAAHPLAHGFGIPLLRSIPTAALGLAAFALVIGLALWRVFAQTPRQVCLAINVQTALVVCMCAVFAGLSYAEAFIIRAWCLWCVVAAGITLFLLIAVLAQRHAVRLPAGRHGRAGAGGMSLLCAARERQRCGLLTIGGVLLCLLVLGLVKAAEPRPQLAPHLLHADFVAVGSELWGAPDAPATLIMLGSYQCAHCRAAMPAVSRLLTQHAGALNVVFCPTARRVTYDGLLLASAAHAAARQGQYRAMHHALFANQPRWRGHDYQTLYRAVMALAERLELDPARFSHDIADQDTADFCAAQQQLGVTHQLFPLPKFVLFPPAGPPVILQNITQVSQRLQETRPRELGR